MKFLIGIALIGTSLYALSGFDVNMDEKRFYDADRSDQNELSEQSQILEYFIKSEISDEIITQYKSGKVNVNAADIRKDVLNQNRKNNKLNIEEDYYE